MNTLVVIDDERIVVEAILAMIKMSGLDFKVVGTAGNGIDGITVIRETKPDIIITDIRIPGLDGLSLIEETMEELPGSVFIVISGYRDFEYAKKALSLKVLDYIDKPITLEKVTNTLKDAAQTFVQKKEFHQFLEIKKTEHDPNNSIWQELTPLLEKYMEESNSAQLLACLTERLTLWEDNHILLDKYKAECIKNIYISTELLHKKYPQFEIKKQLVPYVDVKNMECYEDVREYTIKAFCQIASGLEMSKKLNTNTTVQTLLSYINAHYVEDIGLNELADSVKMNPAYLSILFKENVGMSYIKYLTKIRLDKAKELLRLGMKVTSVSEAVGYNDYRYFSQVFKKNEQMLPNEYKELYK